MIQTLGRLSEQWLDSDFPLRQSAVRALQVSTGLTPHQVETAIDACFSELTEEKIRTFVEVEQLEPVEEIKVLHVLPSNVFTAWIHGAVITLLMKADCWLKPSTHEPVFAPLWKRSVDQLDPLLGQRIRIVSWTPKILSEVETVVAYGSDETLNRLRQELPPTVRMVGYGHRFSVAAIFKEALQTTERASLLDRLLADVEPFRLQGCLSPQVLYVEGEIPEEFGPLSRRVDRMPRLHRFETWSEVEADLWSQRGHLSALGYAGPWERVQALRPNLDALGFSRVCPLGEMQRPPLAWRNGRLSLVEALHREPILAKSDGNA